MEKEPRKEILVEPQWPLVFDGNGYDAIVVGGVPARDQEGLDVIDLIVKPSPRARKRYNLRHGIEIDNEGNYNWRVSKNLWIVWNALDKANERYLYLKSFKHEESVLSEFSKILLSRLENSQRRVLLLEAQNLKLIEQVEIARTNPLKAMKQNMEIFTETGKAIAEMTKRDDKDVGIR